MKKIWKKSVSKVAQQLLTWLGIGTSSMLFMACYGTIPQDYQVIEEEDSISIVMGDSVVAKINMTSRNVELDNASSTITEVK